MCKLRTYQTDMENSKTPNQEFFEAVVGWLVPIIIIASLLIAPFDAVFSKQIVDILMFPALIISFVLVFLIRVWIDI